MVSFDEVLERLWREEEELLFLGGGGARVTEDLKEAIAEDARRMVDALAEMRTVGFDGDSLVPTCLGEWAAVEFAARGRVRRSSARLNIHDCGPRRHDQARAASRQGRRGSISPELSDAEKRRLVEKQSLPPDLVVISPINDWMCGSCSGSGDLLIMDEPGPVCVRCAGLDHLVFLEAGDAALSRRAKKESGLSAVVVRFSRARRRYERQGLLVEKDALTRAEQARLASRARPDRRPVRR
jgi:hypothetical protein